MPDSPLKKEQKKTDSESELARMWQGYWETHYVNDALALVPGRKINTTDSRVVLWITAENPHSAPQNEATNKQANARLLQSLQKLLVRTMQNEELNPKFSHGSVAVEIAPANAVHPAGGWPTEHGFFVFIPEPIWKQLRSDLLELARHFGQNAIVVAEPGKTVRIQVSDPLFQQKLVKFGLPLTAPH